LMAKFLSGKPFLQVVLGKTNVVDGSFSAWSTCSLWWFSTEKFDRIHYWGMLLPRQRLFVLEKILSWIRYAFLHTGQRWLIPPQQQLSQNDEFGLMVVSSLS
jgi:hypothetical protein